MITALVTGANGSVGLGICEQLLSKYSLVKGEIRLILVCRSRNRGLQAKAQLLKTFQIAEEDETSRELIQVVECDLSLVYNGSMLSRNSIFFHLITILIINTTNM